MKLTKSRLKQIIREELKSTLSEAGSTNQFGKNWMDLPVGRVPVAWTRPPEKGSNFKEGDMVLSPDYNDYDDETSVMVDGFTSEEAAHAFVSALPHEQLDWRGTEVGPTAISPGDDEYIPGGTHFASFSLSGDRRGVVKGMVDRILRTVFNDQEMETKLWP